MKIREIIDFLESQIPPIQQEEWDNSGIQVGDTSLELSGVLIAVDITESVISEAIEHGCNLIVTHHPLLFRATKQITPDYYIHKCVMLAIKHDISIYSLHTNLDNDPRGVNYYWAEKMQLLSPKVLLPISSDDDSKGSGVIGDLPEPMTPDLLLERMKSFQPIVNVAHSKILRPVIRRVAYCGGSGAFLMKEAARKGADIFITGEAKYNDFYDAEDHITLMVIGHYESEELTKSLLYNVLCRKKGNFVVRCSSRCKNPVTYIIKNG